MLIMDSMCDVFLSFFLQKRGVPIWVFRLQIDSRSRSLSLTRPPYGPLHVAWVAVCFISYISCFMLYVSFWLVSYCMTHCELYDSWFLFNVFQDVLPSIFYVSCSMFHFVFYILCLTSDFLKKNGGFQFMLQVSGSPDGRSWSLSLTRLPRTARCLLAVPRFTCYVLHCFMFDVSCFIRATSHVLCSIFHISCSIRATFHILCAVFHVECSMSHVAFCILCSMFCVSYLK